MKSITVVTARKYDTLSEATPYVANIKKEYELLKAALEKRSVSVERTFWDNLNYDWSKPDAILIRTVWDYFERYREFADWMENVSTQTQIINPLPIMKWNGHKFYLRDLENKGVQIVPTVFVERGGGRSLPDICKDKGWQNVVIKPAVSAAAFHAHKVLKDELELKERTFQSLLLERDMLVQPFFETIETKGEASLMVFNGKYTHAVLKKAKSGDFRVQDDFGGTIHSYQPSEKEIEFAEFANSQCPTPPVYGRVDIVWDEQDDCYLSEMEFLDPEIWLREKPETAEVLAEGIVKTL
ncbi:ATP-grasp domain-containing protein [Luteirhabdus pelagi]|uniref:ATP-grasp domain-containing protein n=1 Tax=Luteirhabdus pelagi TaxID=2792783 RepID=UPI00193AD350|nr:hypothetical protein [Luteirhabdus pelagi]